MKKDIIAKIASEMKINEFMLDYFNINEITIKDIYENLINYLLEIDKTWKFSEDMKAFIKDDTSFLFDKILQWYSLTTKDLYKIYFEKLKMKLWEFEDKWLFMFKNEIFQWDDIKDLFDWLNKINKD